MPKRKFQSAPRPLTNPTNVYRTIITKPTLMGEPTNSMSDDNNVMADPTAMGYLKETSINETNHKTDSTISLSDIHQVIAKTYVEDRSCENIARQCKLSRHGFLCMISRWEINGIPLTFKVLKNLSIENAKIIFGEKKYYEQLQKRKIPGHNYKSIYSYNFNIVHMIIKNSTSKFNARCQFDMDQCKFKEYFDDTHRDYIELKLLDEEDMLLIMGPDYYTKLPNNAIFDLSGMALKKLHQLIQEKKDLKFLIPKNKEYVSIINGYLSNFNYSLNKTMELDSRYDTTLTLTIMRDPSFELKYISKKGKKEPLFPTYNQSAPSTYSLHNSNAFHNIHPFNPNPVPENRLYYAEASPIQNIDLTNDLSASVSEPSEPINTSNINLEHNNTTIIHSSLNQQISPVTKNDDSSNFNEEDIINELNEIVKEVISISNDEKITVISKEMLDYLKQINSLEENAQKENKSTSLQKIPVLTTDPIEIKKLMDASIAVEKEIDLDKNKNLLIVNNNPTRPPVHNIGFFNSNIHPSCTSTSITTNEINSLKTDLRVSKFKL